MPTTFKTLLRFLRIIELLVKEKASMLRQRWLRTVLRNLSNKIMIVVTKSWSLTRPNREKSVNKLTSNNTRSSTSNGMTIFFRPKKKMDKLSVN
jgi:hypothetical protein